MPKIPIVVIRTPGSQRGEKLFAQLEKLKNFELINITATMASSSNQISEFSFDNEYSKLIYGHPLEFNELACSYSHNRARSIISTYKTGGVILEDDARIINEIRLFDTVQSFLDRENAPSLLNLCTRLNFDDPFMGFFKRELQSKYLATFGPTHLAVGYALNATAAQIMVLKNTPVKYRPDWPNVNLKYFVSKFPCVAHGDSATVSTIDPLGIKRKYFNRSDKFAILFFFYYFRNRQKFTSINHFYTEMWKIRFLNQLTHLKLTVNKLNSSYVFYKFDEILKKLKE